MSSGCQGHGLVLLGVQKLEINMFLVAAHNRLSSGYKAVECRQARVLVQKQFCLLIMSPDQPSLLHAYCSVLAACCSLMCLVV